VGLGVPWARQTYRYVCHRRACRLRSVSTTATVTGRQPRVSARSRVCFHRDVECKGTVELTDIRTLSEMTLIRARNTAAKSLAKHVFLVPVRCGFASEPISTFPASILPLSGLVALILSFSENQGWTQTRIMEPQACERKRASSQTWKRICRQAEVACRVLRLSDVFLLD
jgi:hypothetical protein